ncbi:hypothetical protein MATL_G00198690 [Megalops atlanticus]|uniref:AIG1-type G domain-containing protein n=1 Tax=Megalops atlanticus TaxID=7932 RepID=A0A9D3PLU6_MEGAT|nr:hypothetical protein MATL_G00198690 [Megalops atlanticus]
MRIVLLGERGAGKSSAGNTILGREAFACGGRTEECVRRKGEVDGREVSVVDTPGWSGSAPETPEVLRQELLRSMSLCPSGPHAFLLVVPVAWSLFTEAHRQAAEAQLELFGGGVWRHTVVLFTRAEKLGEASLRQHVERRGQDLQRLVEACGGRCHALSNRRAADGKQVTELLEKIERMVVANDGWHFRPELFPARESQAESSEREEGLRRTLREMGKEMEDMRRRHEQEAKELEEELRLRFEEQWRKRECELKEEMKMIKETLPNKTEEHQPPVKARRKDTHHTSWGAVPEKGQRGVVPGAGNSDLSLALVGSTGAGETAPKNTIPNREEFSSEASFPVTRKSRKIRQVAVVDTPTWYQGGLTRGQRGQETGCCVKLSAPISPAVLLVVPRGQSVEEEWRKLLAAWEIFGEETSEQTMVLLMHSGKRKRKSITQFERTQQGDLHQPAMECDVVKNNNAGNHSQVTELLEEKEAGSCKGCDTREAFEETVANITQERSETPTETEEKGKGTLREGEEEPGERAEEKLEKQTQTLREAEEEVQDGMEVARWLAEEQEREVTGRGDWEEEVMGRKEQEEEVTREEDQEEVKERREWEEEVTGMREQEEEVTGKKELEEDSRVRKEQQEEVVKRRTGQEEVVIGRREWEEVTGKKEQEEKVVKGMTEREEEVIGRTEREEETAGREWKEDLRVRKEHKEEEVIGRREREEEEVTGKKEQLEGEEQDRKHCEGEAEGDLCKLRRCLRPVAMAIGAGVGAALVAVAGALRGALGAAAAGAAMGAVAGAQLAVAFGGKARAER